jgi:hypothetical protein
MNNFKIISLPTLRIITKIWSFLSVAFISFFIVAHLFDNEFGTFNSTNEFIQFLFFPIGTTLGMIISWKWEGIGGFITTMSIILFHILDINYTLNFYIDGLSFPGILFLLCWIWNKKS